jgi:AraC-like DNA-binding protein
MKTPPRPFPGMRIQFSADVFAERERVTAWRDTFGRGIAKVDVEPLPDVPFKARMSMRLMPDLVIVNGRGTMRKTARTRELLADGNDTLVFQIISCNGVATQLGREIPVTAGDGFVLSNADVSSFTMAEEQSAFVLNLPRTVLGPSLHDPDAVLTRPVPKDNAALRLLTSYVAAIGREALPPSEELARVAVSHVHDLVALALGATPDAAEIARTRGVRAARLHTARTFVMRHVGQQGLSVAAVAAHLGVTPRYVHMLFETEGLSFTEFVLAERLTRAHRMLNAPRHAGETISTIAYTAGFADLSHFNRTFRRRYGCTPSDVRAAARGG